MGRPNSTSLVSQPNQSDPEPEPEVDCPFLPISSLTQSDLRETAYEIFFMSCRSSPGFGSSRNSSLTHLHLGEQDGPGTPGTTGPKGGTMMVVNSKIKKALGLKVRGMALMRTMNQTGETKVASSPGRVKRPMTSMEIMRQQMRVTELSDNRLRKTLMRSLVGQSWIPISKSEPYAQSAVDLMKLAKVMVNEFIKIPVNAAEEMTQKLAEGLESIVQDYIAFVESCGKIQCCPNGSVDGHHPRPSTSRGTQRLYIRLNTLYYLHSHIHPLQKSLSQHKPNYFNFTLSTIESAIHHVSEVAAYRLIFLDSTHTFYNGLYESDVESSRIPPALRILKQNLTSLVSILTERAQPGAVKEVMKASFEAFLMVLLAGGSERAFARSDYSVISEDFRSLKRLFCMSGEGLVAEEVVDREAEVVEGIIALMELPTEGLIEEFSDVACEVSGIGRMGSGREGPNKQRVLPMPPTTGKWNRNDPNTVLRVLCHRNDDAANHFLKKAFQLSG